MPRNLNQQQFLYHATPRPYADEIQETGIIPGPANKARWEGASWEKPTSFYALNQEDAKQWGQQATLAAYTADEIDADESFTVFEVDPGDTPYEIGETDVGLPEARVHDWMEPSRIRRRLDYPTAWDEPEER